MIPYIIATAIAASPVSSGEVVQRRDCKEVLHEAVAENSRPKAEEAFGCYTAAISASDSLNVDYLLGHRLAAITLLELGDQRREALAGVIHDDFQAAGVEVQRMIVTYKNTIPEKERAATIVRVYALEQLAAHAAYELGSATLDPSAVSGFDELDALVQYNSGIPFEDIKAEVDTRREARKAEAAARRKEALELIQGLGPASVSGSSTELRELGNAFLELQKPRNGREL